MPSPGGDQLELTSGPFTATVTEVGAVLRLLRHDGRDLVRGFGPDQVVPVFSGAVLAPWPNRVADGRYRFDGEEHQLPLTEPERGTALHGLVLWEPWSVLDRTSSSVTLGRRLLPRPGYPFRVDLEVAYGLDEHGLRIDLTATNTGDRPAPYGCSVHPYLVAGAGGVDDWTLHLPAASVLDVEPRRLLPIGRRRVAELDLDFRRHRHLGGVRVDHAFTDLARDDDGLARAIVTAADGTGVALEWGPACPWVQVHTADRPEPGLHRTGLAVEPMTCPPDAFNSGEDLVVLRPGGRHQAWWRIAPVGPPIPGGA